MQPSPGWTWLKPGQAQGRLVGGCIESLQHLRGTRYWPDFDGALFFWETSEEKPLPETIDSLLMDYENMGVLAQLNGMLVGRSMKYSDAEKAQLRQVILQRTAAYDFPILTDMDFGHTSPQFPLPIGCLSEIDTPARCFRLLEPAIEPALKERS
jgi:muramoyltetrapeptide carboxypeptidase LdcA involved in peptidoglycan recycling